MKLRDLAQPGKPPGQRLSEALVAQHVSNDGTRVPVVVNPPASVVANLLAKAHADTWGSRDLRGLLSSKHLLVADGWYLEHDGLWPYWRFSEPAEDNVIILMKDQLQPYLWARLEQPLPTAVAQADAAVQRLRPTPADHARVRRAATPGAHRISRWCGSQPLALPGKPLGVSRTGSAGAMTMRPANPGRNRRSLPVLAGARAGSSKARQLA